MSTLGMMIGRYIGPLLGKRAEILGGIVLIGSVLRSSGHTSRLNQRAADNAG
jgi:hypothetical protein